MQPRLARHAAAARLARPSEPLGRRAGGAVVQQVVFNLVRNALEAMSTGDTRELVLASRGTADGNVEISVADSGPGLPADPDSMFEPFVSSKSEGMGMGLSISRRIIAAHQGWLGAESRAGGGAVFRFVVPAVHAAERADA